MRVRLLSALLALGTAGAAIPAHGATANAQPDAMHFGHDIVVPAGESLHDALCVLCSVHIDGTVTGDVMVLAGNLHVSGTAARDAADFGGNTTLTGNGTIGRDLMVFGGRLHQDAETHIGRHHLVLPPIVFLPIIFGVATMIAVPILLLGFLLRRNPKAAYPPLPRL